MEACSDASPLQLLKPSQLSTAVFQLYKAQVQLAQPKSVKLKESPGWRPANLQDFELTADCKGHVLQSFGLGTEKGEQGMSATCTPAITYHKSTEQKIDVPGWFQVINAYSGDCLTYTLNVDPSTYSRSLARCVPSDMGQQFRILESDAGDTRFRLRSRSGIQAKDVRYKLENGKRRLLARRESNGHMSATYADENGIFSDDGTFCSAEGLLGYYRKRSGKVFGKMYWPGKRKKEKEENYQKRLAQAEADNNRIMREELGSLSELVSSHTKNQWSWCHWTLGDGLHSLVDANVTCRGDMLLSAIVKKGDEITYTCSHVAALGSCIPNYSTQVEIGDTDISSSRVQDLFAVCPPDHGLQSIAAEQVTTAIRFKYVCCQLSHAPMVVFPDQRLSVKAEKWEGRYCPRHVDDTGRVVFNQTFAFQTGQSPSGTLDYDKYHGQWCLFGQEKCASSDAVHPLDVSLGNDVWHVVPVSDFDAVFEARGAKANDALRAGPNKPPELIKFGAQNPEYLEECKDESHPGSTLFDREKMNE
ncbi:unnamed protein product, partial [Symbiodinium sp. CCMP2592]